MPELTAVSPADVLTLGGASIVVSIIVGVLITAWKPTPEEKDRFGPLVAVVTGVVVVGGFAAAQGADVLSAVLVGLIAGAGSMGVHDVTGVVTG